MSKKIYGRKTKSGKALYFVVGSQNNRFIYSIAISQIERLLKGEQQYVNVNIRKALKRRREGSER